MFLAICMCYFEKYILKYSAHFFNWAIYFLILCCMSSLYILDINPLSAASFANTFSYPEGCLFILFMVSFAVQKLLIRSHLFTFVFIFIPLGVGSKKILL